MEQRNVLSKTNELISIFIHNSCLYYKKSSYFFKINGGRPHCVNYKLQTQLPKHKDSVQLISSSRGSSKNFVFCRAATIS